MTRTMIALVAGLAMASTGCENQDPYSDRVEESAEEAAENRADWAGYDPFTRELKGRVAAERADLAEDVDVPTEPLEDRPASTPAMELGQFEKVEINE